MEIVPQLFYPLLCVAIIIVMGGVATFFVSRYKKSALNITVGVCGIALLGALIASFVFMTRYYEDSVVKSGWYPSVNTVGMIASLAVLLVLLFTVYFASGKKQVNDTRSIVYGAMSVAMSFALSYIRLFKLPQGGTVTFASLLPLMIYCAMFGTRRGIVVCFIYGTLQAIQDPFIIHPVQFLLDYSVAYAFIGLSGIFIGKRFFMGKKNVLGFVLGGVIAVILRYACHVLSGAFAFADYVGEGYTLWAWTFAYNAFALVDMGICLAAGSVLFASRSFTTLLERSCVTIDLSKNNALANELNYNYEPNTDINFSNDGNFYSEEKSDVAIEPANNFDNGLSSTDTTA